jgi:sporulation protein YlmC with PRC-barrel domain
VRASELIGAPVRDLDGRPLGRVADLVTEGAADGRPVVVEVVVSPRRTGRLLGYERPGASGPWLVDRVARLLYRRTRRLPWAQVRIG